MGPCVVNHARPAARRIVPAVVTLRRPDAPSPHEHSDVEWSRRWVVSGHWRNQWYPSLGVHRQIWISPYVKGPEEAPLVVRKDRVFELVR